MKQICANYSKYRLSLDKSTYMSTRSSDYDRLEQKLYNLGATEVNEKQVILIEITDVSGYHSDIKITLMIQNTANNKTFIH